MARRRVTRPTLRRPVASLHFLAADRLARRSLAKARSAGEPPENRLIEVPGLGSSYQLITNDGDHDPLFLHEDELVMLPETPHVRELCDAWYIPVVDERRIGTGLILDADGLPVDEARLVRHPERRVRHPTSVEPRQRPAVHVTEPAVYVGHLGFLHIGHFLTEGIARLWYVAGLPAEDGSLLVYHGRPGALDTPIAAAILSGLGIDRERLVSFAEPARIDLLRVPSPSMVNMAAVSSVHRRLAEQVGSALGVEVSGGSDPGLGPVYLSRSQLPSTSRLLAGEAGLERVLRRHGVRIVHPQELPIVEQMRVFARHRPVIGPIGSAFHLSIFAGRGGEHVYLVDRHGVLNPNFLLLDATGGVRSHYLRCVESLPGRRHKPDGRLGGDTRTFLSPWLRPC